MQPAGYSPRPLSAKLGLKPGMRALLVDAPQGYLAALGDAASTVEWIADEDATWLDFIQMFTSERSEMETRLPALMAALASDGALWLCWPKLASGRPTDLRETVVREIGLATGLVDVKVAAIDAVWSGLKFVYRLRDR